MFLSVVSISKNYVLAWFETFSYFILDGGSWLLLSQILPSLCVTFIQQWLFYFNLFYSFSFFFLIKREEVVIVSKQTKSSTRAPTLTTFTDSPSLRLPPLIPCLVSIVAWGRREIQKIWQPMWFWYHRII